MLLNISSEIAENTANQNVVEIRFMAKIHAVFMFFDSSISMK